MMALAYWFLKAIIYQKPAESFKHSAQVHQGQTDLLKLHTYTYTIGLCKHPSTQEKGITLPALTFIEPESERLSKNSSIWLSVTALFKVLLCLCVDINMHACVCACNGGHDCSVPITSRAGMCSMINWWDHGPAWLCTVWDQTKLSPLFIPPPPPLSLFLSVPLARSAKGPECWLALFCIFEGRDAEVSTFHL